VAGPARGDYTGVGVSSEFPVASCQFPVPSFQLPVASFPVPNLSAASSQQPAASSQQPAASSQQPAASSHLSLLPRRRRRCRRHRLEMWSIALLDRGTNLRHARAGTVHLHRVTRDIEADGSRHAVRFPGWATGGVTALNEAVVVVLVAGVLASAKARDVVQHFGMPGGERVYRSHDLHRSGRLIETDGQRGQFARIRLRWRRERDRPGARNLSHGRGRCRRLRLGCARRRRRLRSTGPAACHERRERQCGRVSPGQTRHQPILPRGHPDSHAGNLTRCSPRRCSKARSRS